MGEREKGGKEGGVYITYIVHPFPLHSTSLTYNTHTVHSVYPFQTHSVNYSKLHSSCQSRLPSTYTHISNLSFHYPF